MTLSDKVEKLLNKSFSIYNFLTSISFLVSKRNIYKILDKNKKLKNIHIGERCFIVLNGPSLKNYDLHLLKNEFTICTNYFFKTDLLDVIKPNYYCITDTLFFNNYESKSDLGELFAKCNYSRFFFNISYNRFFSEKEDVFLTYAKHMPTEKEIRSDLTKLSSAFISVSLYALNAAIFMGFKEIYLLGYDFEPGLLKHFYKESTFELEDIEIQKQDYEKSKVCEKYLLYSLAQFQNYYMQLHAKNNNIKIYNCNINSYVKSFPFIKFDSIFRKNVK